MNRSNWLKDAIFYEIYPQSFHDSNGDGIGDLNGIIEKLDYIRELGCNALWLNPCFTSPFMDAGYDVADYMQIAPRYGTNEDMKRLCEEVHKRDMHLLLDLVPGHTSVDHPWFKESMKAEPNAYSDRYIWSRNIWDDFKGVGNIAGCIRGISGRNGCCAVNFFSTQPALNYGFSNPSADWQKAPDSKEALATREAMKEVMRFWLALGCDGFRVDMAGSLVKNDTDGKETIKLWQDFRTFLDKEYPQAVLVSEWGEPDKSLQGGFHMDFLLHFGPSHYLDLFRVEEPYFSSRGKGDISEFMETYVKNYKLTEGKGLICIPSGNHDMPRIAWRLNPEELKIAFAFLLSMPGVPFLYYGDEIGMRYLENLTSVEGGYDRTGSRTPMQWNHEKNAGFSEAEKEKLYICQDEEADRPLAEEQMQDEDSLWHEVKRLIALRKSHPALLSFGSFETIYVKKNAYPLIYKREADGEMIYVVLNPSGKDITLEKKEIREVMGAAIDAVADTATVMEEAALLYSVKKPAVWENGTLMIPAQSATFFLQKR